MTPVLALIVATPGVADVHVPPDTVDVNVVVPPVHIPVVPLKVPALKAAATVTVLVALTSLQPPLPVTV